jgi:cyclic pyranopterin monophosphate synthase
MGTSMPRLTHADAEGRVHMVDVSAKPVTARVAVARGFVRVSAGARRLVRAGGVKKGDPLQTARVAGIMAAKGTATLIPLCHPLPLTGVQVVVELAPGGVAIEATVTTTAPTGVEMEALTAVAVAGLTVYDMLKAVDKAMVIEQIRLVEKRGGQSGDVTGGKAGVGKTGVRKAGVRKAGRKVPVTRNPIPD